MRKTIQRGLEEGMFPGAVVCVARYGDPYFFEAHGLAEQVPNERSMSLDLRFDLASLTQVVATVPSVLRSVQMGKLSLADPIARFLPEFATGVDRHSKGIITVFDLLTHQSGLPAWKPFYLQARGVRAYLRTLADTPLESEPGERVIRSDLGYMLLGFALERIWDRPLQDVCERLVFGPLDLTQTSFAGEGLPSELCVAAAVGNEWERKQCELQEVQEARDFPWREHSVCGESLDGNAFYGLDGVSGHAGLFSTAGDLNRFAEMWIRKGLYQRERFLDPTLITVATSCHVSKRGDGGGCGWMTAGREGGVQDTSLPLSAYGIHDRSGLSLWCDPLTKISVVALTNANHPREKEGLAEWRCGLHKKVYAD